MIQTVGYLPCGGLNVFKVDGNADRIKRFGLNLDFHKPIMPVQTTAWSVVAVQNVRGGKIGNDT